MNLAYQISSTRLIAPAVNLVLNAFKNVRIPVELIWYARFTRPSVFFARGWKRQTSKCDDDKVGVSSLVGEDHRHFCVFVTTAYDAGASFHRLPAGLGRS